MSFHSVPDKSLLRFVDECEGLTNNWPSKTSRRKVIGFVIGFRVLENEKEESTYGKENRDRKEEI